MNPSSAPTTPKAQPADPMPSAARDASATPDVSPSVRTVIDYLAAWGVGEAPARVIAQTLDARIDPEVQDTAKRGGAMLEALDRWTDEVPDALGMSKDADRVAFVMAVYGGRLLDTFPEALEQPAAFLDAVRGHLEAWENGVLPKLEHQEMQRQPLGDLPAVLRGEFWSGTYRWVMPAADRSVRKLAKNVAAAADPTDATNEDPPPAQAPVT